MSWLQLEAPIWWRADTSPDKKAVVEGKSPFAGWFSHLAPWDNLPCGCYCWLLPKERNQSFQVFNHCGLMVSQKTARLLGPGCDYRSTQPCVLSNYWLSPLCLVRDSQPIVGLPRETAHCGSTPTAETPSLSYKVTTWFSVFSCESDVIIWKLN